MKDVGGERDSDWGAVRGPHPKTDQSRSSAPKPVSLIEYLDAEVTSSQASGQPTEKGHAGGIGKCMGQQQVRGYRPEVG